MTFGRKVNGFCLKKGKREHRSKINNISLVILHAYILNTELQPQVRLKVCTKEFCNDYCLLLGCQQSRLLAYQCYCKSILIQKVQDLTKIQLLKETVLVSWRTFQNILYFGNQISLLWISRSKRPCLRPGDLAFEIVCLYDLR